MEEERKTGVSDKRAGADGAESKAGAAGGAAKVAVADEAQSVSGAAEVFVVDEVKSVSGAAVQTGLPQGAKGRPLTEQAEREMKTLEFMIGIYCRKKHKHKDGLCAECKELLDYARLRRSLCPFGDKKTFCSNCKIHCYKKEMHEKMRNVMKFAGPRMIFYDPKQALGHVAETIRVRRQRKREEKERKKQQKRGSS